VNVSFFQIWRKYSHGLIKNNMKTLKNHISVLHVVLISFLFFPATTLLGQLLQLSFKSKKVLLKQVSILLIISTGFLLTPKISKATHAMGLDLIYEQVGVDSFLVTLALYRDCEGVAAPANATINIVSPLCGESFTLSLPRISISELDVVCASLQTTCNGGTYPGAQEHLYQRLLVLPQKCIDWELSYRLCCRNNAINTIENPLDSRIYVETLINNTIPEFNSSPRFSVNPVPFMCVGKSYCFNNGAVDPDGDSLVYSLITPTTGAGAGDTVIYFPGYDAYNPITSVPALTFSTTNGDFCMTPQVLGEVSVMQVLIEEFRNGVKIGAVERDIQLRVVNCPNDNTLPYTDGINGTGTFHQTICAGEPFEFFTNAVDPDVDNNVTMVWNAGIAGATFDISSDPRPQGLFSWTPDSTKISNNPYCFVVNLTDDNCPFFGTQSFSYCLTVVGVRSNISSIQDISCFSECTGSATVNAIGGVSPYSYLWNDPSNQNLPTASNLCAGDYIATVTDALGCTWTSNVTLIQSDSLSVGISNYQMVSCKGDNDALAVALGNGGTPPYNYQWSNSAATNSATGLSAGFYTVTVTDNLGCEADTLINITEPATALSVSTSSTMPYCRGGSNGSASINATGGYTPYVYLWSNGQTTSTATGLVANTYQYTITDDGGCAFINNVIVSEPALDLVLTPNNQPTQCFGESTGQAEVIANGGITPYVYQWDINAFNSTTSIVNNLYAGDYLVSVTDNNLCEKIITVTIVDAPVLQTTITVVEATCSNPNGTTTIMPAGGNPPYTFLWQDGATIDTYTGLFAGIYHVTIVDNNLCELDTFILLNNIEPNTSITDTTHLVCFGDNIGSATLSVTGGLTPYTYLWSDGQTTNIASSLSGGLYFVTTTDNNLCNAYNAVEIFQPNQIIIHTDSTPVICYGQANGTATVMATGGTSPFVFSWDGNTDFYVGEDPSGLPAGTFFVTLQDDNGCTADTFIVITQPSLLEVDSVITDVSCFNGNDGYGEAVPSGGISPYHYLWIDGQTTSSVSTLMAGIYQVSVYDSNNCLRTIQIEVSEPLGMNTDTLFSNVSCYQGSDGTAEVLVFGGTTPYTFLWSNGSSTNTTSGLFAGNTFISVTDANNCLVVNSVSISEPVALAVTISTTEVLCFEGSDGTASIEVAGGISPYIYQWQTNTGIQTNNTAISLSAGFYQVTVIDDQFCQLVENYDILEPDTSIYLAFIIQNTSCFGASDGEIETIAQGGTSPYI
jgi:hypothetical protein